MTRRKAAMTKLEGIHYVCDGWTLSGQRRKRKPTLEEIHRTRDVCAAAQAASDKLRAKAGLPPVPANCYREALEAEIAKRAAEPAKKARKPKRDIPAELAELASRHGFKVVPA